MNQEDYSKKLEHKSNQLAEAEEKIAELKLYDTAGMAQ